ncbi:MAG: hypothetical protein MJ075_04995 [Oscillospiraceae bacterium]|nr:hypothetical protein [Oscillospiraceae bacterium]
MSKHRSAMSLEITERLLELGFHGDFARIVGEELNTDFVAKMMLGYLRDARPSTMEEVADEMLGILEFRKRCVEKQIAKKQIHWENWLASYSLEELTEEN